MPSENKVGCRGEASIDTESDNAPAPPILKAKMEKTCLSYWFPRLAGSPIWFNEPVILPPLPKTIIIRTKCKLIQMLDGKEPEGFQDFLGELREAAEYRGYPCFLRTGYTSGFHHWRDTCCLTRPDELCQHVFNLVEYSNCVDVVGWPTDVWAVREMLAVEPHCILPCYLDLPLVTEVRCFIGNGNIQCAHPYWPMEAIIEGLSLTQALDMPADLIKKAQDIGNNWEPIAMKVAKIFNDDGEWSVDLLKTRGGWFITDMAEANRSFHWEGCEKAPRTPDTEE